MSALQTLENTPPGGSGGGTGDLDVMWQIYPRVVLMTHLYTLLSDIFIEGVVGGKNLLRTTRNSKCQRCEYFHAVTLMECDNE